MAPPKNPTPQSLAPKTTPTHGVLTVNAKFTDSLSDDPNIAQAKLPGTVAGHLRAMDSKLPEWETV